MHVIPLVLLFCFNLYQNLTGEDLLAIAADQPFRFPATFTFVVRAFSGLTILHVEKHGCNIMS